MKKKKLPNRSSSLPKTKLIKEISYFTSGLSALAVDAFSPLQQDLAEADLLLHAEAQDFSHDAAHDFAQSPDLASALASLPSAAFFDSSFLGSLSKFTLSTCTDEATRFCTLSEPKVM